MKALFNATIYRAEKTTGIRAALILTCFAGIVYYVLAWLLSKGELDASSAGSVTAMGDAMIIWLFGSLSVGMLIGNDFENKTVHGAMGYGIKNIVANYFLVFSVIIFLMLLTYTIGSLACIFSGNDMKGAEGAVISNYLGNVLVYGKETSVAKLILSYVAAFFVYVGQLSICIPVAIRIKKPVVVTAFGFIFGMLTALISTLASKVKMLDNIYRLTPYDCGMDKIGICADVSDMLVAIIVSVVFTALMGLVSYIIFRKSDIK